MQLIRGIQDDIASIKAWIAAQQGGQNPAPPPTFTGARPWWMMPSRTKRDPMTSMLDRTSLSKLSLTAEQTEAAMTNALKAISLLRDTGSLPLIEKLAREDPNLRVREAARRAAEAIRSHASLSALVEDPDSQC